MRGSARKATGKGRRGVREEESEGGREREREGRNGL